MIDLFPWGAILACVALLVQLPSLPSDPVAKFELSQPEVFIGRMPTCQIRLSNDSVSRQHARLYQIPAGWCIQDMGSRNGVVLNGSLIEQHAIKEGDILSVGELSFVFIDRTSLGSAEMGTIISTATDRIRLIQSGHGTLTRDVATAPIRPVGPVAVPPSPVPGRILPIPGVSQISPQQRPLSSSTSGMLTKPMAPGAAVRAPVAMPASVLQATMPGMMAAQGSAVPASSSSRRPSKWKKPLFLTGVLVAALLVLVGFVFWAYKRGMIAF
jgi:pSer/pThr/pTyr-binding forkhead associated (FHA) protein